jgi:hypothetical protein
LKQAKSVARRFSYHKKEEKKKMADLHKTPRRGNPLANHLRGKNKKRKKTRLIGGREEKGENTESSRSDFKNFDHGMSPS